MSLSTSSSVCLIVDNIERVKQLGLVRPGKKGKRVKTGVIIMTRWLGNDESGSEFGG